MVWNASRLGYGIGRPRTARNRKNELAPVMLLLLLLLHVAIV
jgi:hypothetical protein